MSKTTLTKTITLEIEVEVEGNFSPSTPDVPYLRNGDPGYPGDPASFEITSVKWGELDITKKLEEDNFDFSSLEEECIESCDNNEPDYEDDDDYED